MGDELIHQGTVSFDFFSSGVLELLNVSNLPACSHYHNCIVFGFDKMHPSIPFMIFRVRILMLRCRESASRESAVKFETFSLVNFITIY